MAKPILRIGKIHRTGNSTPQSVQGHLSRVSPTRNADPARTHLNQWLVGGPDVDLSAAINAVIDKAGINSLRLRKDATLANDMMLSISPEWFRPNDPEKSGTWSDARLKLFKAEATDMLKKTFGARVISAVLHLDEATPHIQAVIVPIMKKPDGGYRLSGRDMFDPERLASLQQNWEDRMSAHGVGPRTKGSKASHTTLKEYYGALEAFKAEDRRLTVEISDPPQKGLFEASEAHQAKIQDWKKSEAKRIRDELRPMAVEASRGRLHEAERLRNTALRSDLSDTAQSLAKVREMHADALTSLKLSKAEISTLRATPINAVASMLGHTDPIGPKENAIDLVKRVGELDYNQAVTWLAQRFGADVASTAIREEALPHMVQAEKAEPVTTKAERTKAQLISKQLDALSAPSYRITVMIDRDGKRIGVNLGKKKDEPEKLFSKKEVLNLIPRLTSENSRGGNIFVTPIDPAMYHVLADDITPEGLKSLKARGYNPALVTMTSNNNHQCILKVPVTTANKDATNEWFKDLNRDLGDQKITGLVHPFRLVGFENRKEKHKDAEGRYPFVKLVEAVNRVCERSIQLVKAYAQTIESGRGMRR